MYVLACADQYHMMIFVPLLACTSNQYVMNFDLSLVNVWIAKDLLMNMNYTYEHNRMHAHHLLPFDVMISDVIVEIQLSVSDDKHETYDECCFHTMNFLLSMMRMCSYLYIHRLSSDLHLSI
jgi:hypothetical protein